jgi:hypothetical protein
LRPPGPAVGRPGGKHQSDPVTAAIAVPPTRFAITAFA